ncbi:MAG: hypothetical protein K2G40_09475, partial [Muribaculaceae bacterium]|nr:hypothetical protein [Muribaculaceae bacterium]
MKANNITENSYPAVCHHDTPGNIKYKVLFVCLGNICRSPAAEELFRQEVMRRGNPEEWIIDSAGTGDWHVGDLPD